MREGIYIVRSSLAVGPHVEFGVERASFLLSLPVCWDLDTGWWGMLVLRGRPHGPLPAFVITLEWGNQRLLLK